MIKLWGWLVVGAFVACALFVPDPYLRPKMYMRERSDYMVASGGYLSWPVKVAFVEGRIVQGMPRYLVEAMYGEPDLIIDCPNKGNNMECDIMLIYKTSTLGTRGSVGILGDTVTTVTGQLRERNRL